MATISASWTENVAVSFDDTTPAKTVEGVGPIDLAAAGYISVSVQVRIVFGGSADGDAVIRVRCSPDSGTTKDTILLTEVTVPFTASATKNITLNFTGVPWIEVGVYNGNTAVEDISISADYAGLKYAAA